MFVCHVAYTFKDYSKCLFVKHFPSSIITTRVTNTGLLLKLHLLGQQHSIAEVNVHFHTSTVSFKKCKVS